MSEYFWHFDNRKSEISEEMEMRISMGKLCYCCGLQYTLSLELQTEYQKLKYEI